MALDVNWAPSHTSPRDAPHAYTDDLVTYLNTTFESFRFMPPPVRDKIPMACCVRIAELWLALLSKKSAKSKFNLIGMCNLERDLTALEAFAEDQPVAQLVRAFQDVRRLIALVLYGEIETVVKVGRIDDPSLDSLLVKLVDILPNYQPLRRSSEIAKLPSGAKNFSNREMQGFLKKLKNIRRSGAAGVKPTRKFS
uniref:Exocyst complex subunit EXOC6/Sec15 C-terminal domain-containing protein n=1 Tax=Lotharella oceanica TaxID=641309 RepID=A0A7S2TNN4_9EUKA